MAERADHPWMQTRSGKAFPLIGFTALDIDLFGDIAEALARICRFGGHVQGNPYSVAQHCVVGADCALEETGDATLAAYVLLHDAHEPVVGDMVRPLFEALRAMEFDMFGSRTVIASVIGTLKFKLDVCIWKAAGLPLPNAEHKRKIADYDLRLLATEQRHLLAKPPKSWGAAIDAAAPLRLRGRLAAWPVAKAAEQYRARLETLCPNARRV